MNNLSREKVIMNEAANQKSFEIHELSSVFDWYKIERKQPYERTKVFAETAKYLILFEVYAKN